MFLRYLSKQRYIKGYASRCMHRHRTNYKINYRTSHITSYKYNYTKDTKNTWKHPDFNSVFHCLNIEKIDPDCCIRLALDKSESMWGLALMQSGTSYQFLSPSDLSDCKKFKTEDCCIRKYCSHDCCKERVLLLYYKEKYGL